VDDVIVEMPGQWDLLLFASEFTCRESLDPLNGNDSSFSISCRVPEVFKKKEKVRRNTFRIERKKLTEPCKAKGGREEVNSTVRMSPDL
jgi:hypothetical protein